ncbi:MAG: hypothetical protein ACQESE_03890 [Nanobdellota archaeon]
MNAYEDEECDGPVASSCRSYPTVIAGLVRRAGIASEEMSSVIEEYLVQTALEGVNIRAFEDEA